MASKDCQTMVCVQIVRMEVPDVAKGQSTMDQMTMFQEAEGIVRNERELTLTNDAIQQIRREARELAQREIEAVLNGTQPALSLTERPCLRIAS